MRALYPGWENHVKYARVMTVSAVEMQEEDVFRNLQNTISNYCVEWQEWCMGIGGGVRDLIT
jgi:hypothetical protein